MLTQWSYVFLALTHWFLIIMILVLFNIIPQRWHHDTETLYELLALLEGKTKPLVISNAACAELSCFPMLLARMNFRTNSGAGVIWNSMKLMWCHCYVYRLHWFLLVVYIDILVLNYVISHNSALETPQLNTLRPRQDGHHFLDDIFKYIFLNGNLKILIKISLKFVPEGSIN